MNPGLVDIKKTIIQRHLKNHRLTILKYFKSNDRLDKETEISMNSFLIQIKSPLI